MKFFFLTVILLALTILVNAQTNFTKFNGIGGPVLLKGAGTDFTDTTRWDFLSASDPEVIFYQDTFRLWYTSSSVFSGQYNYPRVGYAWSLDGISWIKYPANSPVFSGTPGTWDSLSVETVSVLIDTAAPSRERYKMWYLGENDIYSVNNTLYWGIGYAWSADGINWTKHPNPVLEADTLAYTIDRGSIEGPSVIKDGDTLKMYYAGFSVMFNSQPWDLHFNIIYAWSLDGINWNKKTDLPVLAVNPSQNWEDEFVQDPKVLKIGTVYHMWYGAKGSVQGGQQIGHATSYDGINWMRSSSSPLISTGGSGAWDEFLCSFPTVVYNDNVYHLWYTGADQNFATRLFPYYWDIGYACDSSGVTSINDNIILHNTIHIYPNPTSNELFIEFDTSLVKGEITFTIHNSNGHIVKQLGIAASSQSILINPGNLNPGLYIITLKDNSGLLTVKKVLLK
jgi:hypothetical protein